MNNKTDTRIYGGTVDIDSAEVRSFWNKKAKEDSSLKAVLLGTGFAANSGILRNEREKAIMLQFIEGKGMSSLSVLDIGCGIGRWAFNLESVYKVYHGIDFSQEFIKAARVNFPSEKCRFFEMSAANIESSVLQSKYDLIIVTGVAMYINDGDIERLFSSIVQLGGNSTLVYFQESISILEERLTLKDFESEELHTKYNSIYRTSAEYENLFKQFLPDYRINNTDLLLDKDTGAREETNARFWFLTRGKQ